MQTNISFNFIFYTFIIKTHFLNIINIVELQNKSWCKVIHGSYLFNQKGTFEKCAIYKGIIGAISDLISLFFKVSLLVGDILFGIFIS